MVESYGREDFGQFLYKIEILRKNQWKPAKANLCVCVCVCVCVYICICMRVFTSPSTEAECDTRSILEVEFNRFEFSVFLLLNEVLYQSLMSWRENIWRHAFLMGISAMEMITALSKIWTLIAVFISYDDNHYIIMSPKWNIYIYIYIYIRYILGSRSLSFSLSLSLCIYIYIR